VEVSIENNDNLSHLLTRRTIMQLKYRGCAYNSDSSTVQAVSSNITLTYRGVKYQPNAAAPQFATPQNRPLMYRGSMYFAC
jgi:hypothetical protein